jgi:hypothetical protein
MHEIQSSQIKIFWEKQKRTKMCKQGKIHFIFCDCLHPVPIAQVKGPNLGLP